jgi:hypothetical protein
MRGGEEGVVADLRVGVEGQVVGQEAEVVFEQHAQPFEAPAIKPRRMKVPEEPVVDEHELGVGGGRALEQLALGRHARGHSSDSFAPGTCKPFGPRSSKSSGRRSCVR